MAKWQIGGKDAPPAKNVSNVQKIPYVALQRANEKMTESQKEGVRVWNAMVNTLREAGLMEDKQ